MLRYLEPVSYTHLDVYKRQVLYTAEHTEAAIKEACQAVRELRENGSSVSRYDEIETVEEYVNKLAEVQLAKNAESDLISQQEEAKNNAQVL